MTSPISQKGQITKSKGVFRWGIRTAEPENRPSFVAQDAKAKSPARATT